MNTTLSSITLNYNMNEFWYKIHLAISLLLSVIRLSLITKFHLIPGSLNTNHWLIDTTRSAKADKAYYCLYSKFNVQVMKSPDYDVDNMLCLCYGAWCCNGEIFLQFIFKFVSPFCNKLQHNVTSAHLNGAFQGPISFIVLPKFLKYQQNIERNSSFWMWKFKKILSSLAHIYIDFLNVSVLSAYCRFYCL